MRRFIFWRRAFSHLWRLLFSYAITAANNVKVGDANSAGRIKNVDGTFTSVVSSGQTKAAAAQLRSGYSAFIDGSEIKGSMGNASATMSAAITAAASFTPEVSATSHSNVTYSTVTTTAPTTGYYLGIYSPAQDAKTVAATVTLTKTAGYLTAGTAYATPTTTVGLNASAEKYVVIQSGSASNGSVGMGRSVSSFTPVISTTDAGNVSVGTKTTTKPSSGYYVAVQSASQTSSTVSATVTLTKTEGYIGAGSVISHNSTTVGLNNSAVTYVPITASTTSKTDGTASAAIKTQPSATASVSTTMLTTTTNTGYKIEASSSSNSGTVAATVTASNVKASVGYVGTAVDASTAAANTITTAATASASTVTYIVAAATYASSGSASATVTKAPAATATTSVTGMVTTTTNTGYVVAATATASSGIAAATVTASTARINPGYTSATLTASTSAKNAVSTEATDSANSAKYIQKGVLGAAVSSNSGGSASIAATGFTAVASGTTAYYVTLSTSAGSVKAKASVSTEGYVKSETAETSATSVSVSGNGNKIYIPTTGITASVNSLSAPTVTISKSATGFTASTTSTSYYISVSKTVTNGSVKAYAKGNGTGMISTSTTNTSGASAIAPNVSGDGTVYIPVADLSTQLAGSGSIIANYLTTGTSDDYDFYYNLQKKNTVTGILPVTTSSDWVTDHTYYFKVVQGSATTPATSITANPSLSTTFTTGSGYKMSVSKTQSVTPTVSAGYVSTGTAGNVTVSGSAYVAQSTLSATSMTSSNTAQTLTIYAGYYPTNRTVTIAGMAAGGVTYSGGSVSATAGSATASATVTSSGISDGVSTTATSYYVTAAATATATGGNASISDVKDTRTAGYLAARSATTVVTGSSKTGDNASDNKSSTIYLKAAGVTTSGGGLSTGEASGGGLSKGTASGGGLSLGTASGGGLSKGTASGGVLSGGGLTAGSGSVSGSNVTLSTTNTSGISVSGYGSVSRATINVSAFSQSVTRATFSQPVTRAAFSQSVSRASFSQTVSRAAVTDTRTAGYLAARAATTVIAGDSTSVSLGSASETVSLGVGTATVTLSSGSTTVELAAQSSAATSANSNSATKYITDLTVPAGKTLNSVTLATGTSAEGNQSHLNTLTINSYSQLKTLNLNGSNSNIDVILGNGNINNYIGTGKISVIGDDETDTDLIIGSLSYNDASSSVNVQSKKTWIDNDSIIVQSGGSFSSIDINSGATISTINMKGVASTLSINNGNINHIYTNSGASTSYITLYNSPYEIDSYGTPYIANIRAANSVNLGDSAASLTRSFTTVTIAGSSSKPASVSNLSTSNVSITNATIGTGCTITQLNVDTGSSGKLNSVYICPYTTVGTIEQASSSTAISNLIIRGSAGNSSTTQSSNGSNNTGTIYIPHKTSGSGNVYVAPYPGSSSAALSFIQVIKNGMGYAPVYFYRGTRSSFNATTYSYLKIKMNSFSGSSYTRILARGSYQYPYFSSLLTPSTSYQNTVSVYAGSGVNPIDFWIMGDIPSGAILYIGFSNSTSTSSTASYYLPDSSGITTTKACSGIHGVISWSGSGTSWTPTLYLYYL